MSPLPVAGTLQFRLAQQASREDDVNEINDSFIHLTNILFSSFYLLDAVPGTETTMLRKRLTV